MRTITRERTPQQYTPGERTRSCARPSASARSSAWSALLTWLLVALPLDSWAAAAFEIHPGTTVLEGEPIELRLTGLPKLEAGAERVTIRAARMITREGKTALYRSQAVFDLPKGGTLDVATAVPVQGSYRGADVRGLFWSMRAAQADEAQGSAQKSTRKSAQKSIQKSPQGSAPELGPGEILLVASVGGRDITSTRMVLQRALPQVSVVPVEEFPGAIFASMPAARPRPAVIVLGGSEGNAFAANETSPRLASRGFAVLGLPYHSPAGGPREFPELPATFVDIPVERLNAAFAWLQRRKDVDSSRVALYGVSKGAEFVLIAASRFKWVTAAVAIVPTDVVWEGFGAGVEPGASSSFAVDGQPLPFVPYQGFDKESERTEDFRVRRPHDAGRAAYPAAAVAARIAVERFAGPLLLVGAHDDQVWASGMMALNIAERRAAVGLQTENLVFSEAGHLLSGTGFQPLGHLMGGAMNFGGTIEATAQAQAIAFPYTMAFLRRVLAAD